MNSLLVTATDAPCHVVDSWQEWVRKGKPTIERKAEAVDDGVKLEEQVWVIDLFKRAAARQAGLFGTSTALPVARIAEEWTGNHPRLLLVLDALVADGELKLEGRGTTRKYVRTETPLK